MKLTAFVTVATCIYLTQALAAEPLPTYLKEKLDEAVLSTSVQLDVNDTLKNLSSDKAYRHKVTENMKNDLNGWGSAVESGANSSLVVGTLGGTVAVAQAISGPAVYKSGLGAEELSIIGVLGGVASSFSGLALHRYVIHKEDVKYLLNDSNADRFATDVSSSLAKIFLLSAAQQGRLKYALLDEVHRKKKAGETSPIELMPLLKNTNYAGKPLLSEKELEVFAELLGGPKKNGESKNSKGFSEQERIGFLIRANAMLEVQGEARGKALTDSSSSSEWSNWHKAMNQKVKNTSVLEEIKEFYSATQAEKSSSASQPGGNTDAE